MEVYTKSGDRPSLLSGTYNENDNEEMEVLNELLRYPMNNGEELGNSISRYNGAIRSDITKERNSRIVRSPHKFLTILRYFEAEANIKPSYGLTVKKGSRKDYIHFLLEMNTSCSVGIFYYDSKRMLSVPQIHNVERLVKQTGLKGGVIIANKIGMPAKQETKRINKECDGPGILTIEHYDSLAKRFHAE